MFLKLNYQCYCNNDFDLFYPVQKQRLAYPIERIIGDFSATLDIVSFRLKLITSFFWN
jgi:hypothetical protein